MTDIVYYLAVGMLGLMQSGGHLDIRTTLSTYGIESTAVYVHHTNSTLIQRTMGKGLIMRRTLILWDLHREQPDLDFL